MKKPMVRREVTELSLLFDVSQILENSDDLSVASSSLLKTIANYTGMLRGTISMLHGATKEIVILAAHGLSAKQKNRGRYKVGEGVIGCVVEKGRPMAVPRVSDEPRFLDRTRARKNLEKEDMSFICVPIKSVGAEVIGALSVDRLFSDEVSLEEDVRLLTIIASMIAQAVRHEQRLKKERERLLEENERLSLELKERFRPTNMIGNSSAMQETFDLISQVAQSDTTVLLRGESGVGKELVAHAVHYNSLRASKPFIRVSCAALPETVIESELFGHEKGAFTGAINLRKGRFERADGGTIFLDEIGDLSAATQIHLLRVLQERELERVGGSETIAVDVRVVAATNRDLEDLMEKGQFRSDLFYRLDVFPIHVPPLRERGTDILLLANYFVEKYSQNNNKSIKRISTPAIDMLSQYHWPGNVRELENCIERAVILSTDDVLHGHHLPPTLQTAEASDTRIAETLQDKLDSMEREFIIEALKDTRGNKASAARLLGISERVMGLRVEKFALEPRDYRKKT